jgi:hypothetical protein
MIVREDKINLVLRIQEIGVFRDKGLMVGVKTIWAVVAMVREAGGIFSEAEEVRIGISQISIMAQWIMEITIREMEAVKDMVEAMGAGQDF